MIDTMGFNPALIRASADILGANNVMAGSDWPIVNEKPIREALTQALRETGLSAEDQQEIAAGNCLRLLGLGQV